MPRPVRNPVFDDLFDAALPDVLGGTHQRDTPPVDGGRWPVTVVARPPSRVRAVLEQLMREVLVLAGSGHFVTGRDDSVHLTVRALEPYREAAGPADPIVRQWHSAVARAAAVTPPLELSLTGVTMSRAGVLAQVETMSNEPWDFLDRLRAELGELAWFEDQWTRRNMWYATLIHFAADIADPSGLVAWVRANRQVEPIHFTVDEVHLVRSRYRAASVAEPEHLMAPEWWLKVPLSGAV